MRNVTLDEVFAAVYKEYDKIETDDPVGKVQLVAFKDNIRAKYAEKHPIITDSANACLDRFVTAELDHVTEGDRGIGRMTDHIKRFAAKHRSTISRMDSDIPVGIPQFRESFEHGVFRPGLPVLRFTDEPKHRPLVQPRAMQELWARVVRGRQLF